MPLNHSDLNLQKKEYKRHNGFSLRDFVNNNVLSDTKLSSKGDVQFWYYIQVCVQKLGQNT